MDPFVGEIRMLAFEFAPTGWALCNGQILPITQNTALFSLLGTTYGGDGRTTFGLPDLQGVAPMHPGQGPGLSTRTLGERGGSQTVTLQTAEIPSHNHSQPVSSLEGTSASPEGRSWAGAGVETPFSAATSPAVAMGPMLAPAGAGLPHNNMQPYLTLNFCIALQGIYPPRD